jgi:hypothetical protein
LSQLKLELLIIKPGYDLRRIGDEVLSGVKSFKTTIFRKEEIFLRKPFLVLIIVVLMMSCFSSGVFAGSQDFDLYNETGVTIYNLYISPSNSGNWGHDILGTDVLMDGDSTHISFTNRYETYWDIKIKDKVGNSRYWSHLNLKQISVLTLYYDGERAWAEWE